MSEEYWESLDVLQMGGGQVYRLLNTLRMSYFTQKNHPIMLDFVTDLTSLSCARYHL